MHILNGVRLFGAGKIRLKRSDFIPGATALASGRHLVLQASGTARAVSCTFCPALHGPEGQPTVQTCLLCLEKNSVCFSAKFNCFAGRLMGLQGMCLKACA